MADNRLVDERSEGFDRRKFCRIGKREDPPDAFGDHRVRFAAPSGVVEDKHDDPIAPGAGLLREPAQQRREERLRRAVGDIPEALASGRKTKAATQSRLKR